MVRGPGRYGVQVTRLARYGTSGTVQEAMHLAEQAEGSPILPAVESEDISLA